MLKQLILIVSLIFSSSALAQKQQQAPTSIPDTITFKRIPAPAEPGAIPLYRGAAPGSEKTKVSEVWDEMPGVQRVVRNVTRPTITPVLPKSGTETGAAVVVVAGGGFKMIAMDNEGWPVAQWLADHGIAAFVLKYRLNETPVDPTAFMEGMARDFMASMTKPEDTIPLVEPRATIDALRALELVRANSDKWKIDPSRVGMIGFSAGSVATLEAAIAAEPGARPDYFGYIYGPMAAIDVPDEAPPMFAAMAMDDPLFGNRGFGIIDAWRKANRPVEFHAYEVGGHGFGIGKAGTTTTLMLPQFLAWMESRGLLETGKP